MWAVSVLTSPTTIEGLASLFEKQDSTAELKAAYEEQLTELYAEIGKLTSAP